MVDKINLSPRITYFEWGHIKIENIGRFRDAKLYPGGASIWDWSETGTHHDPGIQPADTEELVEHGAQIIILSQGIDEKLKVMPETIATLEQQGITVHVLQSEKAVELYNALSEAGEAVGALIHSTC